MTKIYESDRLKSDACNGFASRILMFFLIKFSNRLLCYMKQKPVSNSDLAFPKKKKKYFVHNKGFRMEINFFFKKKLLLYCSSRLSEIFLKRIRKQLLICDGY